MSLKDHATSLGLGVVTGATIAAGAIGGAGIGVLVGGSVVTTGFFSGVGAATVSKPVSDKAESLAPKKITYFASSILTVGGIALAFSAATGHAIPDKAAYTSAPETDIVQKIDQACKYGSKETYIDKNLTVTITCPKNGR